MYGTEQSPTSPEYSTNTCQESSWHNSDKQYFKTNFQTKTTVLLFVNNVGFQFEQRKFYFQTDFFLCILCFFIYNLASTASCFAIKLNLSFILQYKHLGRSKWIPSFIVYCSLPHRNIIKCVSSRQNETFFGKIAY